MALPQEPKPLFDAPVPQWTVLGAIAGTVLVVGVFAVAVVISGADPYVIGAAGLVAPFGGAGFGAMLGAVLGGIRAHEREEAGRRPTDGP